jgi:hypothetical protein
VLKIQTHESEKDLHNENELGGKKMNPSPTQDRIDDLEFINTVKNWTIGALAIVCVLLIIGRYL